MGFLSDILGKGWEGAKWLFDSSPLKPASDYLRKQEDDTLLGAIPGYTGAKAITGAISGLGGLVGAGLDKPRDQSILNIPGIEDILGREAEEGLPTALETVAPIDIITLGASGLASAIPKGVKGVTALSKLAKVADVSEGLYGVENVGEGLLTGDYAKAGAGVARMAGGLGGLIPGVNKGVGRIDNLEDVVELGDTSVVNPSAQDIKLTEYGRAAEGPGSVVIDDVRQRLDFEDAQRLQSDEMPVGGDVQLQYQLKLINDQLNNQIPGTPEYDYLLNVKQNLEAELSLDIPNDITAAPKSNDIDLQALMAPEKAKIAEADVFNTRFQNMASGFFDRIKGEAARVFGDPSVADIKVNVEPIGKDAIAFFDVNNNSMTLDPTKLMEMSPEEITKTILHEIAHKKEVHEFGGVVPEDVTEVGGPEKGIFSIGEGKIAEVDPSITEHTWENMRARGAVSPIESQVVTAQESLFNNPDILEQAALFEQNLGKLRGERGIKTGDPYAAPPEFDPKTSITPEKLKQLELDGKLESEFNRLRLEGDKAGAMMIADYITNIAPGASKLSSAPKPKTPKSISQPADLLRKVLTETKLTKFNKNTLIADLEAKGIPVPDEVKAKVPELLAELKERGWVNEKVGGTYTLQIEPPKRVTEIAAGKIKPEEEVIDIEEQLKKSLEQVKGPRDTATDKALATMSDASLARLDKTIPKDSGPGRRDLDAEIARRAKKTITPTPPKTPNLKATMKEKLTESEMGALSKLFGKSEGGKKVLSEVQEAQEAAIKASSKGKKVKTEPPSEPPTDEFVPVGGEEQATPSKSYEVTLSDGTTHRVKAPSPEEAQTKAEAILSQYNSTKTVDKVEESLSTLEKAAKYEIEPTKQGMEEVKDIEAETKRAKSEEVSLMKREDEILEAQRKERLQAKKGAKAEEVSLMKEEDKLRAEQTKEKFQKKPFTVMLSNGKEVTVHARNEQAARELVSSQLRTKKSNLTVTNISKKQTQLEKAISKGQPGKEPKFGREAITPEDTFTQAWAKLTPTQMVSEVGAIIKSMRGSLDLPMLRQGKIMTVDFLTTGNAKELANALRQSKDVTFGKKTMDQINAEHAADPITSKLVSDFGLDLPGIAGHLKEEAFHSGTAEKVPLGVGKVIKKSNDVYTVFLNEARVSEAKRLVKIAEDAGFNMSDNPDVYKSLMKAVNIIGSRGDFKRIGPALNEISNYMWAPRLKLSRGQLLTSAAGLGDMHPFARAELRKSLGRVSAVNMSLLGLAALAGANVETNPRNSDWGKIRVGETRIDPWFGLQPMVRAVALAYAGKRVSATTGTERKVSVQDLVGEQITSGAAPGITYPYEMIKGESLSGYPVDRSERALLGVSPLIIEDIYDAFKQYGLIGVGVGGPAFLGEGVNTFEGKKSTSKKKKKRKSGSRFLN